MSLNHTIIIIALVAGVLVFWQRLAKAGDRAAESWKLIGGGALLIDVRTENEYKAGHLEGALQIPYEEVDRLERAIGSDTGRPVVVYCRTGRRSGIAMKALMDRGYTNIVNGGGYAALLKAKPATAVGRD